MPLEEPISTDNSYCLGCDYRGNLFDCAHGVQHYTSSLVTLRQLQKDAVHQMTTRMNTQGEPTPVSWTLLYSEAIHVIQGLLRQRQAGSPCPRRSPWAS